MDGAALVTCDRPSGSTFSAETTTVTCSAVDAAGNRFSASFTVTMVSGVPLVTVPQSLVAEAIGAAGAVVTYPAVTAVDPVDGVIKAACTPTAGSTFVLGAPTVTCRASNWADITGQGAFTAPVQDTTGRR